ncbi:hypothetical protein P9112_011811 [Eukaryota sp. TZLM1-RC]
MFSLLLLFLLGLPCLYYAVRIFGDVRSFFLLDLSTYKPPPENTVTKSQFMEILNSMNVFSQASLDFQRKILYLSGLGDSTALPSNFFKTPPTFNMTDCTNFTCSIIFETVSNLLQKLSFSPSNSNIDYVIVTSSFFSVTPTLAHRIIDHFSLPSLPISLVGMGCAESLIAVDLARKLLKQRRGRCLVVSVQPVSSSFYFGSDRSMLIPNSLFRLGCTASLFSNLIKDSRRAKFSLSCVHRSISLGESIKSLELKSDFHGHTGFSLCHDLLDHYLKVIRKNLKCVAPKVFPTRYLLSYILQFVKFLLQPTIRSPPSWPSFSLGADHFCLHVGGRGVLDVLEESLDLNEDQREPSRAVLERYGNVSGSGVFYALDYLLENNKLSRGSSVWMLGYGAGLECVSAYMRCRKVV